MRKDVRILLVGEAGVGKTSLILSLVSEEFPEEVPAKAEEITIPADVTPEKVPTHIVDYSNKEQDEESLAEEIIKAHVICTVYSVDDEETIQKIRTYWLPLIRQVVSDEHRRPVILVGNKCDMLEVSSMESILPIMNEFAEVETCVECSAKTLRNISEVFYYAQKSVLHPNAPLYLPADRELTPNCKQALTRIFKICDQDSDGLLNDKEIYQFQRRCFNVPLQPQALEDVKAVVRKHITDGIVKDGITQRGFLFLHTLFIQRGRHETTWTVLRKFGYDDNLQVNPDYLWPPLKVPPGCSTELSHQGYQFFASLFEKYDEDKDECLSPTELHNLFSTCPSVPWSSHVNNTVCTNSHGWLTISGYLAQWALMCMLDVPRTLEHLAYLGYMYEHESQLSAVQVTRDKKIDLQKKQTTRNVFHCQVYGARGAGKTSFLQSLLGRNVQFVATLNQELLSQYTINLLPVYGQDKYLLLEEMTGVDPPTPCDVIALLYDVSDSHSFSFCQHYFLEHLVEQDVPVLVVACKADRQEVCQHGATPPTSFCRQHRLPAPLPFSCIDRINRDAFIKLATMATYPHLRGSYGVTSGLWLKVGLGLLLVTGVGFVVYRYSRQR